MPRPARRLLAALALALAGTFAVLAVPAAAFADAEAPAGIAPADGSFVEAGAVVLEWTAVDAPDGYEVVWADAAGQNGSSAATFETSAEVEVGSGSFSWQVRALPDGAWSQPATFHADLELPTLPLPDKPAAAPVSVPRGVDAVPGSVWLAGAIGFSAVFLAVVLVHSRVRREQDA